MLFLCRCRKYKQVVQRCVAWKGPQVMNEKTGDKWVNDAGNYLFKDSIQDNIDVHTTTEFAVPPADAKATHTCKQQTLGDFISLSFLHFCCFRKLLTRYKCLMKLTKSWIASTFDPQLYHAGLNALKRSKVNFIDYLLRFFRWAKKNWKNFVDLLTFFWNFNNFW